MTLRKKLWSGLTPGLVLILALGLLAYGTLRIEVRYDETVAHTFRQHNAMMELQMSIQRAIMPPNDYLSTGDPVQRDRFAALAAEVEARFVTLEALLGETEKDRTLPAEARDKWQQVRALAEDILALPDPLGNARRAHLMQQMDTLARELIGELTDLQRQQHAQVTAAEAAGRAFQNRVVLALLLVTALALAFTWRFSSSLRHLVTRLHALAEASHVIAAEPDLTTTLERIVQTALDVLEADRGAIYLLNDTTDTLSCACAVGLSAEYVEAVNGHYRQLPGSKILSDPTPVVILDACTDPRLASVREAVLREGFRSFAALPLAARNRIIGALAVYRDQVRAFDEDTLHLTRSFADQAAIALERIREHQALKEAEARYRGLFDGVPVGLYRTTPAGQILDANPALVQMMGYQNRQALLAVNATDFYVDPGDRAHWQARMEEDRVMRDFETRLCRSDGTVIWVRDSARAVRDEADQVVHYEGSLEDITAHKRAEEELRRRAVHLEALNAIIADTATAAKLPDLLRTALDHTLRALGLEMGAIWLNQGAEEPGSGDAEERAGTLLHPRTSASVHVLRGLPPEIGLDIPSPIAIEDWQSVRSEVRSQAQSGSEVPSDATLSSDVTLPSAPWLTTNSNMLAETMARFGIRASLTVPITSAGLSTGLAEGRRIGGLSITAPEPRPWSAEEIALVESVGQQVSAAAERLRLLQEARDRAERMTHLATLSEALNRSFTVAEVVEAIGLGALALSGTDRAAVYLLNKDDTVACPWSQGLPPEYVAQVTTCVQELPGGRLREHPEPVLIPAAEDLPEESPLRSLARAQGYQAVGLWPLVYEGQVIAAVGCHYDASHTWSSAEQEVMKTFCRQAAVALENARLYAAEQTQRQELDALYGLSRQLVATDEMQAMLGSVARHAVEIVHVTFSRVLVLEDGAFICRAAHPVRLFERDPSGLSPSGRSLGVGRPEPSPAWAHYQRTLNQAQPLVLKRDDPALSTAERQALFLDLAQSLCLAPLRVGTEAVGVLALGEAREESREPFGPDKLRLTAAIADQAASALHRARLHEQLEAAYIETVLALASAVDARDSYTGNHSRRLAVWAEATARELGCSGEEIQTIRWAALLHDIGKIGVPDHILQKPGPLDGEERAVIRRHPEIGERIVAPVKKLANVAPVIRAHQERWDGTGYPDELKGEAIPREARILAVVDAYGAMTEERVYHKAGSHEEAVAELRRCAGTQFDPHVVEAFLRVLERGMDTTPGESVLSAGGG